MGQLIAEYSTVASSGAGGTSYLTADHLGSTRVVTDSGGNVKARHDYLPFGEEIPATIGGRSSIPGYTANDTTKQRFTGKERDGESGLDYFLARYYSSAQGRFTGPDPTLLSVNGHNPQSWNRYTYVLNNPLIYIDPLGLWEIYTETERYTEGKRKGEVKRVNVFVKKSKEGDNATTLAKQLGLSEKEAKALEKKIGDKDNIQLSKLGGDIGSVFGKVESGLTEQVKYEESHPGETNRGPTHSDCSRVACSIAFPNETFGVLQVGVQGADALITELGRPVSEEKLRVGDIARYARSDNRPQHFASFIFRDDSGVPQVFSKSGERGPYERLPANDPKFSQGYGYGSIRGISKGDSGFYRAK
jgi:RHS repeat-associated protein